MSRAQDAILKYMMKIMEVCKAQGFVYGIVPEKGKPMTESSDNLHEWWKETVQFDQNAPIVIATLVPPFLEESAGELDSVSCKHFLQDLHDTTLGSLLSALIQHCVPPQRSFPRGRGLAPPWWPTGNEIWWGHQGSVSQDQGPQPYRRPHDLKKAWKVSALAGIIKNMSPNLDRMRRLVSQSKYLQEKILPKRLQFCLKVVNQEVIVKFAQKSLKISTSHESNIEKDEDDYIMVDTCKRKCTYDPEAVEDKLYGCQNSDCRQSELWSAFTTKNLKTEHESTCSFRTNSNFHALNFPSFERKMIHNEETHMNDFGWMNDVIESANDEKSSAVDEQTSGSPAVDYGQFWGNNMLEQFRLSEMFGTEKEMDTIGPLKKAVDKYETSPVWDLKYESRDL